jgi:rubrerythrin
MTNYEFFKLAEQVEELSRRLYLVLADHASTPPGVRELFQGLADEEEQHRQRLQLLAATLKNSPWASQLVREKAAGIEGAAAEFQAFLAEVTGGRRLGDLMGILDRLVKMEQRLSFVHAEQLAAGAGPGVSRLFDEMARQDRRHQKLLERLRKGQPPGRA